MCKYHWFSWSTEMWRVYMFYGGLQCGKVYYCGLHNFAMFCNVHFFAVWWRFSPNCAPSKSAVNWLSEPQLSCGQKLWTLNSVQYTVYGAQCTVHGVQCTVYRTQYTEHSIQCIVCSVQWTMYSIQCKLNILNCKTNNIQFTRQPK